MRLSLRFASVALCCMMPVAARAQAIVADGMVRGQVIDERTLVPLARVRLTLLASRDTIATTSSDSVGRFTMRVSRSGEAWLHLARAGYQRDSLAVTLGTNGVQPVNVALAPAAALVAPAASVIARNLEGFESRARRKSGGSYFRRTDIEGIGATQSADVVRRVSGLTLVDSAGVLLAFAPRSAQMSSTRMTNGRAPIVRRTSASDTTADDVTRPATSSPRGCELRVSLDGRLMEPGFSVNDVPIADVEAIEVYRGPGVIPVDVTGGRGASAPCGVIAIWRRTERP